MTTVKVKFRASTVQGKEGRLLYKVTHNRLARQVKSTYTIYPAEWNESTESIVMDGADQGRQAYLKDVDSHVRQDITQLNRIVVSLDKKGASYTSDDVVKLFEGNTEGGFVGNARTYIKKLEEEKRPKATNYRSAVNSFLQFTNGKDIPIAEITTTVIKDFEEWLLAKGLVRNSTSAYMRSLQAIYKHIMSKSHLKITGNPFGNVYRGVDKTEKNLLNLEQIRLVKDADLHDKLKMAYARDLFMFAFYTHASMVDIAYMKPQNIKMGVLFYKNHRSGETEMVKWEKVMNEIVQRYALSCKGYLLPIITDESEATTQYKHTSHNVGRPLAQLGKRLGLPIKLTMEVARDSWYAISKSYFDRLNGMIIDDLHGKVNDTTPPSNPQNVTNTVESHVSNQTANANIPEAAPKVIEPQQEEANKELEEGKKKEQGISPRKSVKQDELWNTKWQAYMDFIATNNRRPSKYKKDDMVLVDWFRHSKKLLRRGLMKVDRVEKFQQLLNNVKRVQHKTVHSYDDGETTDKKFAADETGIKAEGKDSNAPEGWMRRYNEYAKFLESNGRIPSSSPSVSKDEHSLYMWLYFKKSRLKRGRLRNWEKELIVKLLPCGEIYERYVTVNKTSKGKTTDRGKSVKHGKGLKSDFQLYDYQQD